MADPPPAPKVLLALDLLVLTLLFANGLFIQHRFLPNWDNAWMLTMAGRLWDGGPPAGEVILMTAPPYLALIAPANLLAMAVGIPAPQALLHWTLLLVWVSFRIARPALIHLARGGTVHLFWLGLGYGLALAPLIGFDLGQRDHLFLVLFLPAVLLTCSGVGSGRHVTAGMVAALGCAIKPFFLLPALALYLTRIALSRPRSPTPSEWAFLLTSALLTLWSVVAHPGWVAFLPRAMDLYGSLRVAWDILFFGSLLRYPLLTLIVMLAAERLAADRLRTLIRGLSATALAAWLAMLLQGRGWPYHQIPVSSILFLTLWILLGGLAAGATRQGPWRPAWRRLLMAVGCLLLVFHPATLRLWISTKQHDAAKSRLQPVMAAMPPAVRGRPMMILSARMAESVWLFIHNHSPMAGRFPAIYGLEGLLRLHDQGRRSLVEKHGDWLFSILEQDWDAVQPSCLVVDLNPLPSDSIPSFNLLAFLHGHPGIARRLDGYAHAAGPVSGWLILVRKTAAAPPLTPPADAPPAASADTAGP